MSRGGFSLARCWQLAVPSFLAPSEVVSLLDAPATGAEGSPLVDGSGTDAPDVIPQALPESAIPLGLVVNEFVHFPRPVPWDKYAYSHHGPPRAT